MELDSATQVDMDIIANVADVYGVKMTRETAYL